MAVHGPDCSREVAGLSRYMEFSHLIIYNTELSGYNTVESPMHGPKSVTAAAERWLVRKDASMEFSHLILN